MESKPTLTGRCPSCRRLATFTYIGPQHGHKNGVLYFYNCSECGSTVSGRRVKLTDERHKMIGHIYHEEVIMAFSKHFQRGISEILTGLYLCYCILGDSAREAFIKALQDWEYCSYEGEAK